VFSYSEKKNNEISEIRTQKSASHRMISTLYKTSFIVYNFYQISVRITVVSRRTISRTTHKILVRKTKGRNNVGDMRIDDRIILKTTVKTTHAKSLRIRGKLEENCVLLKIMQNK
jgi:hypothetical protein